MAKKPKFPKVVHQTLSNKEAFSAVTDTDLKSSSEMFQWSLELADHESAWGFNTRVFKDEWCSKILPKLENFEKLTWGELSNQPKGRGPGTKHHHIQVSDIVKKARKRLEKNEEWMDVEQLYSLRLDGKTRLYGVLINRKLNLVWYDSKHEIYSRKRK